MLILPVMSLVAAVVSLIINAVAETVIELRILLSFAYRICIVFIEVLLSARVGASYLRLRLGKRYMLS